MKLDRCYRRCYRLGLIGLFAFGLSLAIAASTPVLVLSTMQADIKTVIFDVAKSIPLRNSLSSNFLNHSASTTTPDGIPTVRDALTWPFSVDSIWNQPIGSEAEYVAANISIAPYLQTDEDHFYTLEDGDPLTPVFSLGNWEAGRSTGTIFQGIALPLPDDFAVADANYENTPNNSAAFVLPDGQTLVQVNGLTRDQPGGPVYGWRAADETLYGTGIEGGHAGSGLSSIGGTLRRGELTGSEPIRHALKVNLFAQRYLAYEEGFQGGLGYRWPATRADSYANPLNYGGATSGLMMGSLLAIPPEVTPEALGLQTPAGLKLFHALQDYGAYVADDTAWDAHAIAVETGVQEEFEAHYGYEIQGNSGSFYDDVMALFTSLNIIDNNAPDRIGGGGTPRAPLAPPLEQPEGGLIEASDESDTLTGSDASDRVYGLAGDDAISGANGSDYLSGDDGSDLIDGGPGDDFLFGGNGADDLRGGPGNDFLDGGFFDDSLRGGDGDDTLSGGSGNGTIDGGAGIDTLLEAADVDFTLGDTLLERGDFQVSLASVERATLSGGEGNNALDARDFSGSTRLDGGAGDDVLQAGAADSQLYGGVGADLLTGGPGNDRLVGANELQVSGIDTLTGGAGRDRFILADFGVGGAEEAFYITTSNRTIEGPAYALITDFNPAEDVIELAGSPEQYQLSVSLPVSSSATPQSGVSLFATTSQGVERVAVLQGEFDIDSLALNSEAFQFSGN